MLSSVCLLLALCVVGGVRGVALVTASNPCVYKGSNYTLDLRDFIKFPYKNIPDMKTNGFTFTIDLCTPLTCNTDRTAECACQNGPKTKDNKPHPFSLGKSSSAKWKVDTLDPLDFSVTYQHGDASSPYGTPIQRSSVFHFVYSDVVKTDTVQNTDQTSNKQIIQYVFTITGSHVKLNTGPDTPSSKHSILGYAGLIIIILALVAVVTYFVVGGVFMYVSRGARGVEVIPQAHFWLAIPGLVKDGFVFSFGPLVRLCHREQSYDRI